MRSDMVIEIEELGRTFGATTALDAGRLRGLIGLTGQVATVDELLTGRENLEMIAGLYHLPRARARQRTAELLEQFGLADAAGRRCGTYSGGMRRRLDLAMGLVGRPRVVFLDEPTTGVDPRGRRTMWQIIRDLAADGITIFLTTQYLEEADQLADQIAVLDHGRLVARGSADELKRLIPGGHVRLQFTEPTGLASAAALLADAARDDVALTLQVPSDGGVRSLRALLDLMDERSIEVGSLSVHTPDLDDVFLALTGHATEKEASR
jgi:ABC-2 type transport system ATP-binding protein